MAYNLELSNRIQSELSGTSGLVEKKMFGGVGFMVNGNMACGVNGDNLLVRVGVDQNDEALSQPFTKPFAMTGKPMAGWILVEPGGYASDEQFKSWIKQGLKVAQSLPAK
ncbi:MAG: TfoX/Sxy family protein [Omnitrophica WOR_2 bacterium]